MALIQLDLDPPAAKLRQFGWAAPVMLLTIGGVLRWRFDLPTAWMMGLGVAGVVIFLASRVSPKLVRPAYLALVVLGFPIGWVVSHMVMLVFYYGVLTPVGLCFRLLGRDPLQRRWQPEQSSYWTKHPRTENVARYFRQF